MAPTIKKDDITLLKKPVEMIVMRPTKGKLTLIGRRLYTVMLAYAQSEIDPATFDPDKRYVFRVPLRSLLSYGSFSGKEVPFMKQYLREMNTTSIEWETTAPGDGYSWRTLTMVSEAGIDNIDNVNWISWEFPKSIMENIVNPGMYARLELKIHTSIRSYVGTALYEICTRYRDNPSGVTSKKPVDWWIVALSQTAQDPDKKKEWRKFKDAKLNSAIEDVNEDSDLEIQLIEEKVGRTITMAQFAVRKKNRPMPLIATNSVDAVALARIEKLTIKLFIPMARIETYIRKFGEALVEEKLAILIARVDDKSQPIVELKEGYLRYLLANHSPGQENINFKAVEVVVAKDAEVQEGRALPVTIGLQPDAKITNLRTQAREAFNSLPEPERQKIIKAVVEDLKNRSMFRSADIKHAQSSIIRPGLFGSHVIEYYGRQLHGSAWLNAIDGKPLQA